MALEGTIKEFGLADIFQLIGLQKKTGVLFLNGQDGTVNIYFEDGMVVKAETSQKKSKHFTGRILINREKITEKRLKEALEIQKSTGQKIGSVLVSQGLITKEDLRDALTFQMNETIYRVFRWKGGDYKFYQEKVDYDRDTIVPLNSENILMDGVRMLDEWPMVEKKLPPFELVLKKSDAAEARLHAAKEGIDIFSDAAGVRRERSENLSKESIAMLSLADGKKSVYELLEYSSFGEFDTCKAIVTLMDKGFLIKTGARPEIMREEPVVVPEKPAMRRPPVILDKLTYALIPAALALIFQQVTGTRVITNAGAAGLEGLKTYFAVCQIETINDNAQLYYYDFGSYPESSKDLAQHDYILAPEVADPWGSPISINADDTGALAIISPGPDRVLNSIDDISNRP